MKLSMSAVGARTGLMVTQVGARAIGKGVMLPWNRKVYVKMASTALIFSALQPVRPALHLPVQQHVGPGRVARGNHSSLLLFRQCASTDQPHGVAGTGGTGTGTVLLETRDGSIMYKFGSPDQLSAASAAVDPNSVENEEGEGQCPAPNAEFSKAPEVPQDSELEPVVIVNGVKRSSSPSPPSADAANDDDVELNLSISDLNQKLAGLELEKIPSYAPVTNGIASHAEEAPVKDTESPDTKVISDDVKKDGAGKEGRPTYLNSGAAMIPHPEKGIKAGVHVRLTLVQPLLRAFVHALHHPIFYGSTKPLKRIRLQAVRGGEDAFFIEGSRWIGVADGVGGWANDGINAGLYARELMWNCAELARESEKDSDPKTVLIKGFSKTKAQGSTTAVVASISNQTLNVVNIGDSGFLVIRDGYLIDGSTPMIRGFNFPYQIGSEGDDPLLAEVYRVPVKKGDVVLLASDGLFDNLFHHEIVAIVNRAVQEGSGPEVVAKNLASAAHKAGARNQGLSPFAKEAQRVGYNYFGGKMDDITAVVSFIS